MSEYTIKIVDVTSGEEIEREMTAKESKDLQAAQESATAKLAEENAARESAISKLTALGLTEAEIQALAG